MAHHSEYQIDLRKQRRAEEVSPTVGETVMGARTPLIYTVAAYALLFVMLFSPVARVFADEGAEVPSEVTSETPIVEALIVPAPDPIVEEVVSESEGASTVETVEPEVDADSANSTEEKNTTETSTENEEVSEEEVILDENPDLIPEEGEVLSEATSTPEVIEEEVVEEAEVVAEEAVEEAPEVVYVDRPATIDSSQMLFNAADCVTVNDGEFYCVQAKPHADSALRKETTPTRTVISQKDGDGDLEIYLSEEGVTRQITSNATDDDAPSYDAKTGMIAWHALVNERYQIFIYEPKAQNIIQLTNTGFNNTNPSLDGSLLSWQAWEDGNWEIFYVSLPETLNNDTVPSASRVSRNSEPDMFPRSYGNYITWQARVSDSWRTRGFNTTTGEYSDLGEGTGGDISSARLVLLVERRGENGEIERVGYEVETGAEIPLGTSSAPAPVSAIPESPIDGTSGSMPETNAGNALKTASRADGDTDSDSDSEDISE